MFNMINDSAFLDGEDEIEKTSITILLDAKVDPRTVKQLSGHKKVDCLAMY